MGRSGITGSQWAKMEHSWPGRKRGTKIRPFGEAQDRHWQVKECDDDQNSSAYRCTR